MGDESTDNTRHATPLIRGQGGQMDKSGGGTLLVISVFGMANLGNESSQGAIRGYHLVGGSGRWLAGRGGILEIGTGGQIQTMSC